MPVYINVFVNPQGVEWPIEVTAKCANAAGQEARNRLNVVAENAREWVLIRQERQTT